ncbi:MAG: hypothetical protein WBP58_15465 [Chitinophagaceae bacterium]
MNELDVKMLWQQSQQKIEALVQVNRRAEEDITKLKVNSLLGTMKPVKVFAIVAGILWVFIVGGFIADRFINHYAATSPFLLYAGLLQVILTALAIGIYMYQLYLINAIDFSEPVLQIQERLSKLIASTLNVTRILFLQMPLWKIFFWNESMFRQSNWAWWILNILLLIAATILSIWLFVNIRIENKHKRWFKWLFNGPEWKPMMESVEMLKQIKAF